jgi:hypothetical protein
MAGRLLPIHSEKLAAERRQIGELDSGQALRAIRVNRSDHHALASCFTQDLDDAIAIACDGAARRLSPYGVEFGRRGHRQNGCCDVGIMPSPLSEPSVCYFAQRTVASAEKA